MEPNPRKYKSFDELPELPPEMLEAAERIAKLYAPVLKALAKY